MKRTFQIILLLIGLISFSQNNSNSYSIYVSDAGNYNNPPWQIIKYDAKGQNPEVFIKDSLAWPQDILFLEGNNEVLISNLNSGKLNLHDTKTGVFKKTFASNIAGPTRTKIGKDGLLYVLQWAGNGKVLRYDLDGTLKEEFTSVGVPQSIGMDWDSDGNLYVSSFQNATISKFDKNGKDLGLFVKDNLQGPTNIWFNEKGNLYVLDWKAGAIVQFDSTGKFIKKLTTELNKTEGIAFLPNGNFMIGNGGTGEVKLFSKEGVFLKNIVAANHGSLKTPNAVVLKKEN